MFAPYLAVIDGIPSQVFLIAEFCFGAALLAATVKWIAHSGKPLRPAGEQRAIDTFLACCAAMLATDITFSTFRITLATGDLFSLELFLVIQNALVTALALAALIWFVGARRLQGPHLADLPDVTMPMNPLEKRIVEVLERGVYLDSELTVTTLAQKTGCTVAALRACISEELGYANFRQMINHYRIESAKEALRSSKHGLLSIQDVALTSGFKSMASFHRIFKDATSQTPSAYRTSTGDKP
ncbi:MAG: helix-turn-helix transcriptional regulator [Pseudomonadota bacterium]